MRRALFIAIFLVFANAATAAKKSTLIIQADSQCQLFINGEASGVLEKDVPRSLQLVPGKQLINCKADNRHVERTETSVAGRLLKVKLVLLAAERFVRVAEGIKDNVQNLIWAQADNGRDIGWKDAEKYCADLGKGWKLPNGTALQSLYNPNGKNDVALDFNGTDYVLKPATSLIKFSGGGFWSDEQNDFGVWGVNLADGTRYTFTFDAMNFTRALCVRPS